MTYVDPSIPEQLSREAEELGWMTQFSSETLKASDWGQLKQKLRQQREDNHFITVISTDHELDRRASQDPRIDVLFPEEFDETVAEQASENSVAVGLNFSEVLGESRKARVETISNWRDIIEICERKETDYIITTGAENEYDLRPPEGMKAFINSVGGDGDKAVEKAHQILEKNREKLKGDNA